MTTTWRQKMSLKAAKFPPWPIHLLHREHGDEVYMGQAEHSPKHLFSKAEYVVRFSPVLILVFICIY
jgi:hypothetical protein